MFKNKNGNSNLNKTNKSRFRLQKMFDKMTDEEILYFSFIFSTFIEGFENDIDIEFFDNYFDYDCVNDEDLPF